MASDYVTKIIEIVRFMTSHVNFWAVIYLIMFFGSIAVLLAGCFFLIRVLISVTDTKSYQERGVTEESLVFFSSIAKNKTLSAYKKKVQKTDNAQFEEDIISQIYICSIMRTLPLVPAFKEKLLAHKKQQDEYRRVCGKCYDKRYLDYICVDEMGTLISPHYLTSAFPKLLDKNGLRHIRFHDLRHSCASLLLSNGVSMKQIQEWLGHSDFSTTANVYAHLDYNSKLSSADAMVSGLKGALRAIK